MKAQFFLVIFSFLSIIALGVSVLTPEGDYVAKKGTKEVVDRVLKNAPLIDTHNDVPWNIRRLLRNRLSGIDFSSDLTKHPWWYKIYNGTENGAHTDIPRMRASGFGGQFWSVFTECKTQLKDSVAQTLEQIDVVKRLSQKYPNDLMFATSTKDIDAAIAQGKIASLIGVEGGHSIQSNYGILRMYYELGARYLTLTHSCNTPWADSSKDDETNVLKAEMPENHGLSRWGMGVVDEMNRLGMMVDLSHTSVNVCRQVLKHSKAPIIFSHSAAQAVFMHQRNVPDEILQLVKSTGSVVALNIYADFIASNKHTASIDDAVAHAQHIKNVAGIDHIGIGCDYDGVSMLAKGLDHVGKLRSLLEALYDTGTWTEEDLEKISSRNVRRVFAKVEQVRDSLKTMEPLEEPLAVGQYYQNPSLTDKFF